MELRPLIASTGETPDTASAEVTQTARKTPVYWSLTQIAIFMVGFSEGLTHLATLAIMYLFKDDLGLSPPQVSLLFVASAFPWFLKPLFGAAAFYSDSYPIFGGFFNGRRFLQWGFPTGGAVFSFLAMFFFFPEMRRKPYLLFFSALEAMGYVLLAYTVTGIIGVVLSLFLIAFSSSFCSAIAEALVVEATTVEERKASQTVSDFMFAKGFGSLIVAYFSGYLLETMSKKTVFLMTATFPLFITVVVIFMTDISTSPHATVAAQVMALGRFLSQKLIWGPCLFILAFMVGPDYDDALFFFYTNVLGFGPAFMGTLRFTYGFAAIAGTLLYRFVLYRTSYRTLLWSSIVSSLPIYLSPLLLISGLNLKMGISDKVFVLSGGFLNEAVAEVQLLPLLALTTRICPPGLEGSAYSTMLAVRSLGSAISKGSSAVFMSVLGITAAEFGNLGQFVWTCGLFNLLPFIFLHLLPSDEEIEAARAQTLEQIRSKSFEPISEEQKIVTVSKD